MIGDLPSIPSNDTSKSGINSSNYSIPEVPECEEDQVTGSQFSNFVLSSGGIKAICGSGDRISALASNQDLHHLTGSLSNRDKMGTLISNYISEEQGTDNTYKISDDSIAGATSRANDRTSKKSKSSLPSTNTVNENAGMIVV